MMLIKEYKEKYLIVRQILKRRSYFNLVKEINEDNDILIFQKLGEQNKDKNIYLAQFDDPVFGFFAYWKRGLAICAFAEKYNLFPVIDWTVSSPYYEANGVNGIMNPFEYYYEQVSPISIEDALHSQNVAFYNGFFNDKMMVGLTYEDNSATDLYVDIVKKYYKLKPDIKEKIENDISCLLLNKKTLGVQIRGVEWGNIKGHPIPVVIEKYVEKINFALQHYDFKQIFLATDSEETIEHISREFPGMVKLYNDVARTPKGSKKLFIFDDSIKREKNSFLMGYEVLRDMLTLSACDGFIASYSNISIAVEITKSSCDSKFEYKDIIPTQINTTGVKVSKAVKQMKN